MMTSNVDQSPRRWNAYWIAFLLLLPAVGLYAVHYLNAPSGTHPTGFIYADLAYYMANAREYADRGVISLTYDNPFDPSPDSPAIYFQPHTALLAIAARILPWEPGTIYVLFGFFAALICARVAIALYRDIVPERSKAAGLGLVLLFWGGGLLVLGGITFSLPAIIQGDTSLARAAVQFDPFRGWWFLNFGRNLLFPNESYTHALFFGSVLFLRRKRFSAAAATAAVLSVSHPFTGIELMGLIIAWIVLEMCLGSRSDVPLSFVIAIVLLLLAHVGYYLLFLPAFPGHYSLMEQWRQAWLVPWSTTILAYGLVAAGAAWALSRRPSLREHWGSPATRLLLAWAAVAFALSHHDVIMRPVQPVHFTRGYVWTPLFLLGAPWLVRWLDVRLAGGWRGTLAAAGIAALLLFDNVSWLSIKASEGPLLGITLSEEKYELLRWVNSVSDNQTLLISPDEEVEYMSAVYTPARPWRGHEYNTPESTTRKYLETLLFERGLWYGEWRHWTLMLVQTPGSKPLWDGQGRKELARFDNREFHAVLLAPVTP